MANHSSGNNNFGIPGLQPWKPDIFKLQHPNPKVLKKADLSLSAKTPPGCATEACDKTENIIIVGSELQYDSFWAKMMFMACGYAVARGTKTPPDYSPADLTSLLVVNVGYVDLERQRIKLTPAGQPVADDVVMITSQAQLNAFFANRNKKNETYKIKNVVVFSHGVPGYIELNYNGWFDIRIDDVFINKLKPDMFVENAIFFSYACRTGAGTKDDWLSDNWFSDPKPDKSLAQYIANKLKIRVRAFYRRTLYSGVMREPSQNKQIAASLKSSRNGQSQDIINLSDEHEALSHPGLADGMGNYIKSWVVGRGPVAEGENNYALWRKQGARSLPTHASDPEGFPTNFATFEPKP